MKSFDEFSLDFVTNDLKEKKETIFLSSQEKVFWSWFSLDWSI